MMVDPKDVEAGEGRRGRVYRNDDYESNSEEEEENEKIFVATSRKQRSSTLRCCILIVSLCVIVALGVINYRIYR